MASRKWAVLTYLLPQNHNRRAQSCAVAHAFIPMKDALILEQLEDFRPRSFRRSLTFPASLTPSTWNTCLAISHPIVLTSPMNGFPVHSQAMRGKGMGRLTSIFLFLLLTTACVSHEELIARDRQTCSDIGFVAGTPEHRDCILRLEAARLQGHHYRY